MMGTPSASRYGYSTGSSYIVFGGNVTNKVTFLRTSSVDSFTNGTSKAEYFAAGDDQALNLINFSNKISDIEAIDLTGNGNNALYLTTLY